MIRLIRRIIYSIIVLWYDAIVQIAEMPRVYLAKQIDYSKHLTAIPPEKSKKIALVAPHPSVILKFTLRNLLLGLEKSGYSIVIAVENPEQEKWIKDEFPNVIIVERKKYGRDFGVWKQLLRAILNNKKIMSNIDRIALVNDSLYYGNNVQSIVQEMENTDRSWSCLFENFEYHYHAQSFFLIFSKEAIAHPLFQRFWRKYRPYSNRRHTINAGEVGLSKDITKIAGRPHCLYASSRLSRRLDNMSEAEVVNFYMAITANANIEKIYGKIATVGKILSGLEPTSQGVILNPEVVSERWAKHNAQLIASRVSENHNPTHMVGIIANQFWGAPIKRDLAQRGSFQIADVIRMIVGYTDEEMLEIEHDLRAKALPVSYTGVKRALFDTGRI